ncbi:MAG: hypothetical protein FJZ01_07160 [Candidatus Sericytochromatia bacterium]|nr:hypothetical protein [Candidatus Tanganyikabacteria bacterium]
MALLLVVAGVSAHVSALDRAQMAGVHIGDSPDRVAQILGKPARPPQPLVWKPEHRVEMWQYDLDHKAGGIPNLSVTFVDGKVWRVAALTGRYTTRDGLRVGDSLDKARELYGTGIEDDAEHGLVPWRFVCAGQVVKVIVEQGATEVLAVGLETPHNLRLLAAPPIDVPGNAPDESLAEPPLPDDTRQL